MVRVLLVCIAFITTSVGTTQFEFSTRRKAESFVKQAFNADNVTGVKLECK